MHRGAWQAAAHRVTQSWTRLKRLCTHAYIYIYLGFCGGSDGKESACNAGDAGLISQLGRSPGEGNDYPLQYSCLENSMDRGAWGCKESDMIEQLTHTHTHTHTHTLPLCQSSV